MRKSAALLIAVFLLSAPTTQAAPSKGKPKKPKPFEVSGHVYLPGIPITSFDFVLSSCPHLPTTQGVSGFVVELPAEMINRHDLVLEVSTSSPTSLGGVSLEFFDLACESLGNEQGPGPVALPPGTVFIETHDYFSANYDVTLRVTATGSEPLVGVATPTEDQAPPLKPYKTSGHITGPGVVPVTWYEFIEVCPAMPTSQGVTGQVIEIPSYLRGQEDLLVTIVGGGELPAMTFPLAFVYFDAVCKQGESLQAPAVLPTEAFYLIVYGLERTNYDFDLTIQSI